MSGINCIRCGRSVGPSTICVCDPAVGITEVSSYHATIAAKDATIAARDEEVAFLRERLERVREAVLALPEYEHGIACKRFFTAEGVMLGYAGPGAVGGTCNCGSDALNAALAAARKEVGNG